jgi:hypothetical protein
LLVHGVGPAWGNHEEYGKEQEFGGHLCWEIDYWSIRISYHLKIS